MSILDSLKDALPVGGSSIDVAEYECQECGHRFESAKDPERATCMECLATDVEAVDHRER